MGAIPWGPLLGLAEVWVVGVGTPQLLAGIQEHKLCGEGTESLGGTGSVLPICPWGQGARKGVLCFRRRGAEGKQKLTKPQAQQHPNHQRPLGSCCLPREESPHTGHISHPQPLPSSPSLPSRSHFVIGLASGFEVPPRTGPHAHGSTAGPPPRLRLPPPCDLDMLVAMFPTLSENTLVCSPFSPFTPHQPAETV